MKPLAIIGVLLILLGLVALVYQGVTYTTTERVVDVGPIKVDAEREKRVPLSPIVGGVAVLAGLVLVLACVGRKGSG